MGDPLSLTCSGMRVGAASVPTPVEAAAAPAAFTRRIEICCIGEISICSMTALVGPDKKLWVILTELPTENPGAKLHSPYVYADFATEAAMILAQPPQRLRWFRHNPIPTSAIAAPIIEEVVLWRGPHNPQYVFADARQLDAASPEIHPIAAALHSAPRAA